MRTRALRWEWVWQGRQEKTGRINSEGERLEGTELNSREKIKGVLSFWSSVGMRIVLQSYRMGPDAKVRGSWEWGLQQLAHSSAQTSVQQPAVNFNAIHATVRMGTHVPPVYILSMNVLLRICMKIHQYSVLPRLNRISFFRLWRWSSFSTYSKIARDSIIILFNCHIRTFIFDVTLRVSIRVAGRTLENSKVDSTGNSLAIAPRTVIIFIQFLPFCLILVRFRRLFFLISDGLSHSNNRVCKRFRDRTCSVKLNVVRATKRPGRDGTLGWTMLASVWTVTLPQQQSYRFFSKNYQWPAKSI